MECSCTRFSYGQTGYYNQIVTDYVSGAPALRPFYEHGVNAEGITAAMKAREAFDTPRNLLADVLTDQYKLAGLYDHPRVMENIELLRNPASFTICTAHQPNIFTGYLYFIYKVLHAAKLADELSKQHPSYSFIPVYYMGSEDADLEELSKVFLNGEKLVWETKQTGAVGRMQPKGLDKIISRIEGELSVLPHGNELIELLKDAYNNAPDIQTATFSLVHKLFADYGVIVLIADEPRLKKQMLKVFEDDLFLHTPSTIVGTTTERLSQSYKVQANPREINLFYLKDDIRNRIEKKDDHFFVIDTDTRFTTEEIKQELHDHPERFSPNVILRGLYQESILPNIAFIGGGGELAYWLELKDLFNHYKVPYPVQILRNSFLLLENKWEEKIKQLDFDVEEFFKTETELLNILVKRDSAVQIHLTQERRDASAFYEHIKNLSGKVDTTLITHVTALQTKMEKQLIELEKKLLRAEKRKFSDQSGQIKKIKAAIFPNNNLQERVDNFMPYYAKMGKAFIQTIYDCSPTMEQEFLVLHLEKQLSGNLVK